MSRYLTQVRISRDWPQGTHNISPSVNLLFLGRSKLFIIHFSFSIFLAMALTSGVHSISRDLSLRRRFEEVLAQHARSYIHAA